jgi:hypothetical protein
MVLDITRFSIQFVKHLENLVKGQYARFIFEALLDGSLLGNRQEHTQNKTKLTVMYISYHS